MLTTPRLGIQYPEGTDNPAVHTHLQTLALALDSAALDAQGPYTSRPVSTPGTPGIIGRYYFANDVIALYRDYGTGWTRIGPAPCGAVEHFAVAPDAGWLLANAQAVTNIAANAELRAKLIAAGNPYGITGSDPLVPEVRGKTMVGQSADAEFAAVGQQYGHKELQSHGHGMQAAGYHGHGVSDPGHSHGYSDPTHRHLPGGADFARSDQTAALGASSTVRNLVTSTTGGTTYSGVGITISGAGTGIGIQGDGSHAHTVDSAGSGNGKNIQPSIVIPAYIKL